MFSERTNWKLERNRFTQAIEEARADGAKMLDLTASNPTRVGLKYDSEAILDALRSEPAMDYDPQAKGLLAARQAVAAYYGERADGVTKVSTRSVDNGAGGIDPERIVLTTSTSEGYS